MIDIYSNANSQQKVINYNKHKKIQLLLGIFDDIFSKCDESSMCALFQILYHAIGKDLSLHKFREHLCVNYNLYSQIYTKKGKCIHINKGGILNMIAFWGEQCWPLIKYVKGWGVKWVDVTMCVYVCD